MSISQNLPVIGSTEFVEIFGVSAVPAKIDTGADSSAIWASNIDMKEDGTLIFSLFGKKSPFYTILQVKKGHLAKNLRFILVNRLKLEITQ